MASGKEIRAGGAFIELFTKDAALVKGLARAQARLKAFGAGMTSIGTKMIAVGAAITAPLLLAAHAAAESGAAIYDMSRRTGLSVEALSRLGYAAERSGTDINTVEGAIRRMQKTISGVKDDVEGTTGSLEFLGLAAADIKGKLPEEQFNTIAARIAAIEDPSERAAAAMKVFGRSGTALIPLIENLATLRARQERLGLVKSGKSAKDMKEFEDVLLDAGALVKSVWTSMASAVLPILKEKTEKMIRLTKTIRDWIRDNKGLIATVFKLGTAIGIAGVALAAFGKAISLIAPVLSLIGSGLGVMVATVSAILTPIGLVTVAIVGLAGYFLFFTETGGKALAWLSEQFSTLKADVTTAVGGVADALGAGDIKLAAQILWAFLRLEWMRGKAWLTNIWLDMGVDMIEVFYDVVALVQTAWSYLKEYLSSWDGVKTAVLKIAAFIANAFENVVNHVADLLQDTFMANSKKELELHIKRIDDAEASGKITPEQAKKDREVARQDLGTYDDKQRAARKAKLDADYAARQKQLDDDFKSKNPELVAEEEAARKKIEDAKGRINPNRRGDPAAEAAAQAEIDQLTKELEDLRKKAADERAALSDADGPDTPDRPTAGDFQDSVGEAKKTVAARGTFNAAAVAGLTTTQIPQQQLDEQKKASKFLKNIDRKLPVAFA